LRGSLTNVPRATERPRSHASRLDNLSTCRRVRVTESALRLDVDITHAQSRRPDLSLQGPTGKRITVHCRGFADTWVLSAGDRTGRDTGKLNRWGLTLTL
jgi:subtilisin-like proprotein convertase family protein